MEIIRCSKGHFYDSEENTTCPYCDGTNAGHSRMPEGILGTDYFGHSAAGNGYIADTAPAGAAPTDYAGNGQQKVQQHGPTIPSGGNVQQFGPTTFVNQGGSTQEKADLVGWLVCVEGPSRGKDYPIRNQNNFIGRNSRSDICIPEDHSISSERSACIVYDDITRSFFFGPMMGKNAVRLNGAVVIHSAQLQAYDVLQVGVSKLLFVPLCGERFDWNEK